MSSATPVTKGEKIPNFGPMKTGRVLEVSFRRMAPTLAVFFGLSWFAYYVNRKAFGLTPESMTPQWRDEARRVGPVSVRQNAPPVFRDPFKHNIPGHVRGPEDLPGL